MAEDQVPAYVREHGALESPVRLAHFSEELAAMKASRAWLDGDRTARTLTKDGALRIVLTAMKQGATLLEHHADGPLSLQCLAGTLRLSAAGQTLELREGDIASIDAAIPHSVEALAECAFLLTIAQSAQDERNARSA